MKCDFDLFHLDAEPGWRKLSSKVDASDPHVSVEHATYSTPSRPGPVAWTIVRRKAAVAVAPMLDDGRFVLIEQERIPVCHTMIEFPAGQVDAEPTREAIVATALSELREETGCELAEHGCLESLGYYFTSAGFTQEVVYLFLARGVRMVSKPMPVGHEHISGVRLATMEELKSMVTANQLTASVTLAIVAKLCSIKG